MELEEEERGGIWSGDGENSLCLQGVCKEVPFDALRLLRANRLAAIWSGRGESNPRRSAWEADILPLNYSRSCKELSVRLGIEPAIPSPAEGGS